MRAVVLDMPPHWLEQRRKSGADRWDEVWNGVLHVSPSLIRPHQDLEFELQLYLRVHWAKRHGGRVNQQVNLTTPEDEPHWTNKYRVTDLVLLSPS